MKNRLAKTAVSFAVAAVLSFTSIAAYAEEVSDIEVINGIDFEVYSNWGIEDHAENIKATYKLDYPEQASIIDEIVDVISGSEEFAGIFEEEGEAAIFRQVRGSLVGVQAVGGNVLLGAQEHLNRVQHTLGLLAVGGKHNANLGGCHRHSSFLSGSFNLACRCVVLLLIVIIPELLANAHNVVAVSCRKFVQMDCGILPQIRFNELRE